ncbi:hypothetical protein MLD38_028317 [Melastoma candidum]|uniref:Uncharacterized protein n=1 Tax=Melastoma candidum TaxID=119954 RepID=A0ACB9N2F6_9MYRT|nr:hypothetical protein MLD38_028317 [Melastoma candidum]
MDLSSSIFNLPLHPQPQPPPAEQPVPPSIPPVPAAGTPGKRRRGRPKKLLPLKVDGGEAARAALPPGISAADATLVSLGLVEEPLPVAAEVLPGKKGRGRPKKNGPVNGLGVGKPAGSRPGKRGRPKKSATAENGGVDSAAAGVKRGRGRPKRISEGNGAAEGAVQGLVVKKLGRGRLRVKSTGMKAVGYSGRKRGRPRKMENAGGGGGGGALVVAGKKRGRPPGRKNSGRPVGRPRKAGSSRQLTFGTFIEEDVLRKFEYVQMKIKDAVGTLRPLCGHSIAAADAIEQLEGLASMDFSTVPLATVAADPQAAAAATAPPAN